MNSESGPIEAERSRRHKIVWRKAGTQLIPLSLMAGFGAYIAEANGQVRWSSSDHKLLAVAGVILFLTSSIAIARVITGAVRKVALHYLGEARAASVQLVLVISAYLLIFLATLGLLAVPIGNLLLGGAVTGIVLGVAAQQSLGNFFASLILFIAHPFRVGQRIIIRSGGLGGEYQGVVVDMGLSHTNLKLEDGRHVLLPNAALLGGAAIIPLPKNHTSAPEKITS